MNDQILKISKKKSDVFSVSKCTNPAAAAGQSFAYSSEGFIPSSKEYGNFDLGSGIFTVKKAGVYQFHFNSHVLMGDASRYSRKFELRVNGSMKAMYHTDEYPSRHQVYHPVIISALLRLKPDDKIGVFSVTGKLHEDDTAYITRFYCTLVSDDSFNIPFESIVDSNPRPHSRPLRNKTANTPAPANNSGGLFAQPNNNSFSFTFGNPSNKS